MHPFDVHLDTAGGTCVGKGFDDALVTVLKLHVFADQGDGHFAFWVLVALEEIHPAVEV